MNTKIKHKLKQYLDEHQFTYKFGKENLLINKMGTSWIIPYWEFQYSDVTIDIIISNYCEKPGNNTLYADKYEDVYALNYIPKWL